MRSQIGNILGSYGLYQTYLTLPLWVEAAIHTRKTGVVHSNETFQQRFHQKVPSSHGITSDTQCFEVGERASNLGVLQRKKS